MDNVCPKCGAKIVWLWEVDHKTSNSSAHAECSICDWWSGKHVSISETMNNMQERIAHLESPAHKLEIVEEYVDEVKNRVCGNKSVLDEYRERVKK